MSRVAGADLWEALMERAGVQGTPVFLIGGKSEVLAETQAKLRERWKVNIVGSQDGYFPPISVSSCLSGCATAGRKLSPSRWDRRARKF